MPPTIDPAVPTQVCTANYANFAQAATAVLSYLEQQIPMGVWMVTRIQDNDWVVLQSKGHAYGIQSGQTFRWTDSYCSRMVRGQGPCIAPDKNDVPAYVEAPINQVVSAPIGAYVGIPLSHSDGSLFGTLCGLSTQSQPAQIVREEPLLKLLGGLLSAIVSRELEASNATRSAEQARHESKRDVLTGLFNRRGFEELLASEEQRCQKYGNEACILSIDLNGLKQVNDEQGHAAGDALIRSAADAMRAATRRSDVVARIGGDEFVILAVDCNLASGEELAERIRTQCRAGRISAAIGLARRLSPLGLNGAVNAADASMYEAKRALKRSPRVA